MPTNVWQETAFSTAVPVNAGALPSLSLDAPPAGIFKKFVLRRCMFQWAQSTTSVFDSPTVDLEQEVHFLDGHGGDRIIFASSRRITSDIGALYDTATNERVYSRFHFAGDDEVGINQQISYGKHTDTAAKTLRVDLALVEPGYGGLFHGAGYYQYEWAVLYLTLP